MLRLLWISLFVVICDQATKAWILASLDTYQVVEVLPVFNLTLVYNTGAAFSFLSSAGGWQRWFLSAIAIGVSVVLVIWIARLRPAERWLGIALALIVGGAVGNLIDRVRIGKVVDFLQWHWQQWYFPSFNVADSAITLGVIVLLVDAFFGHHER